MAGCCKELRVCYLIAAVITMLTRGKRQALAIGAVIILILVSYWAVMRFVLRPELPVVSGEKSGRLY